MKKLIYLTAFVTLMLVVLSGCKKDRQSSNKSSMKIQMTDAPGDFEEVNIDLLHVDINYSDGGWKRVPTQSGIYDLLKLRDSVFADIVDADDLAEGEINQIRLILGPNNSVMVDSIYYDLKVPSGMQSGIKINVKRFLNPDEKTLIKLDFDAEKSVVITGGHQYILKPVILVLP